MEHVAERNVADRGSEAVILMPGPDMFKASAVLRDMFAHVPVIISLNRTTHLLSGKRMHGLRIVLTSKPNGGLMDLYNSAVAMAETLRSQLDKDWYVVRCGNRLRSSTSKTEVVDADTGTKKTQWKSWPESESTVEIRKLVATFGSGYHMWAFQDQESPGLNRFEGTLAQVLEYALARGYAPSSKYTIKATGQQVYECSKIAIPPQ